MYYGGVNKDKKIDKELAIKYWSIGSQLGDKNCTMFLKLHFNESVSKGKKIDIGNEKNIIAVHSIVEFDNKLTIQTIDIHSIKVISENQKHKSNQYAKRIYSTHLKVVKFIKSFKELNMKKSGGGKLKDKFESIKLLASAFRDYDNFIFIRIPSDLIDDVKELVDQLLISSPSNIDVKICWLGLNRFPGGFISATTIHPQFKVVNELMELCKNEKDYSIIKYFEIIFQGYSGKIDIQFNCLIQLLDIKIDEQEATPSKFKITVESDKDIFIYLLLSIINNSELQSSSINNNHLIDCIISNVDSYNSRSIKGNPQNAEINLNLYLLLLNSNYNDNNDKNEIASKYLEIGKSEINYLIPSLKEFNTLDKLLSLI